MLIKTKLSHQEQGKSYVLTDQLTDPQLFVVRTVYSTSLRCVLGFFLCGVWLVGWAFSFTF